ncbi:hypothetical protein [uncultured Dysgonomonas sp.]|uniref:Uncharacterized protein n=1 Tax=uncultured Dysgonomonas sp. TaxID=206096 RepID=A0A212JWF2_9BACT|nr:hypothetical protein [uncultured Dysgonomonas sp.]SBW03625.1 exported hypothetical protein [uncultured Dysgonomonas sp.]
MKKNTIYFALITFLSILIMVGCSDDDKDFSDDNAFPPPTLELASADNLVGILGAETKVQATIESESGIRDAYITLLKTTEKGYVEIDKNKRIMIPVEGQPKTLEVNVDVLINSDDITAIKIVSINGISKTAEQIIKVTDIKNKPEITFYGNVDYSNTVSTTTPLRMRGTIINDCDIQSISFVKFINNAEQAAIEYNVGAETDKQKINFTQMIPVENGLDSIVVRVKNIYNGYSQRTYKINNVVNVDFIDFIINDETFVTEQLKEDAINQVLASIVSASDLESVSFASKTNGTYSAETTVSLPPDTYNEASVAQNLFVTTELQAFKFTIKNKGGVTVSKEFIVKSFDYKARILRDVIMSTDPDDNSAYIALYEDIPVFGKAIAETKQDRIDWVLTKNNTNAQPVSPHAYGADINYYNRSKDYLWGFNTLTYMFLSSRRGSLNKSQIDLIVHDSDITVYLYTTIIVGENYNIPKASRRVGDNFNPGKIDGFIFGWGNHTHPTTSPTVVDNYAFGIGWIKKVVTKENGHHEMTLDIIYPRQDQRAMYNDSKIIPYSPYPLQ